MRMSARTRPHPEVPADEGNLIYLLAYAQTAAEEIYRSGTIIIEASTNHDSHIKDKRDKICVIYLLREPVRFPVADSVE